MSGYFSPLTHNSFLSSPGPYIHPDFQFYIPQAQRHLYQGDGWRGLAREDLSRARRNNLLRRSDLLDYEDRLNELDSQATSINHRLANLSDYAENIYNETCTYEADAEQLHNVIQMSAYMGPRPYSGKLTKRRFAKSTPSLSYSTPLPSYDDEASMCNSDKFSLLSSDADVSSSSSYMPFPVHSTDFSSWLDMVVQSACPFGNITQANTLRERLLQASELQADRAIRELTNLLLSHSPWPYSTCENVAAELYRKRCREDNQLWRHVMKAQHRSRLSTRVPRRTRQKWRWFPF